jgi:hypothetical protein
MNGMPSRTKPGNGPKRQHTAPERRLMAAQGATTLDEAIERAAANLLGEYTIPVSLGRLSRKLSARIVVLPRGATLGQTHRLHAHNEIRIRAEDEGQPRQRFTLAHEYAHLILDQLGRTPASKTLEQLCDRLAAAILMPRTDVLTRIQHCTPAEVLQIAREFEVSLHASAVRFAGLTGCALFRMTANRGTPAQAALPFPQKTPTKRIEWLAGPLRHDPDVRRFLVDHERQSDTQSLYRARGGEWYVRTAHVSNSDLVVVFRRRY